MRSEPSVDAGPRPDGVEAYGTPGMERVMRRVRAASFVVVSVLLVGTVAWADHVSPDTGVIPARLGAPPTLVSEGPIRFVNNAQTGRAFSGPLGEVAPFERNGRRYLVTGSSIYGFSVVDVTDPTEPTVVSEYASAFGCPTSFLEAQAAAPDPLAYGGWENDVSFASDGSWVALGMDAGGRCHDPAAGGVEIVDLSDVANPRTLHLVRNVGYSHSITIDPSHPWLAYISTSDQDVNDAIDVIDVKSCLGAAPEACKPTVARAVLDPAYLPGLADPKTNEDRTTDGCHDIRLRGDRAYCAAIGSTLILDVSKVLRPDGTLSGTHLTAGQDACPIVEAHPLYASGVRVTDCLAWTKDKFKELEAKPLGVGLLSVIPHDGDKPADQDIEIAHQADAIADGTILFVTDERSGGLGVNECPGGGIWFWDIRDERHPVRMVKPDGSPGVFATESNIPSVAGTNPNCTVHYGREFADENLMVFAWYTNGTRMFRYVPDFTKTPAQIRFEEVAAIATIGSAFDAMGLARNPADPAEVLVYVSDAARGIDVFALRTPRLTRARAFGGTSSGPGRGATAPGKRKVGGGVHPGTGITDPWLVGLALLALAAVARRILRRHAD
jgi:hypothetical protein